MDVHVVRTLDELGAPIRAGAVDLVVVGLGQDCELLQAAVDPSTDDPGWCWARVFPFWVLAWVGLSVLLVPGGFPL
jgi:hypothetical protein